MKRHIDTPRYTNLKEEKYLMKNKNNLLKFTNIVLLITMIAIILVSGTYSKYTSTASGTGSTIVANWSFKVNGQDITVLGADENISFNLFDTANIKDSDGNTENDVAEGLIAPGTSGNFEFLVQNTSDVTAEYSIDFEVVNTNEIPIEFSINGSEWSRELKSIYSKILEIGSAVDTVVVNWKWPFEIDNDKDMVDTFLGETAVNSEEPPSISVKATINAVQAGAERLGADGQFKYVKLSNNQIQLSRYVGDSTSVVFPAEYDGYEVYSIGNIDARDDSTKRYNVFGETNATSNNTIKSITISEGIEKIGDAAFNSCKAIEGTLTIPNTIKEIGDYAFTGCSKLSGDLTIPNGVVKIGRAAFQQCSGFKGYLTLPNSLEEIGSSVFNHCTNLANTTLDIPKSLKIIGTTDGGTHTFYNMATKNITAFTMDGELNGSGEHFKVLDGVLMSADGTRLVSYPTNKVERDEAGNITNTYIMPEGVKEIDEMAFGRSGSTYAANATEGLKKIVLANSYVVRTDYPDCFLNKGYNDLAVACYIYTGVEEIAVKADNPNYKTVDGILYSKDGKELWYVPTAKKGVITIEDGVETIKNGAFYTRGANITNIIIPASVTLIEPGAIEAIEYGLASKTTIDPANAIYEIVDNKVKLKE